MSAYSDWKCGALSDAEYRAMMAEEDRRDRAAEEEPDADPVEDWEDPVGFDSWRNR